MRWAAAGTRTFAGALVSARAVTCLNFVGLNCVAEEDGPTAADGIVLLAFAGGGLVCKLTGIVDFPGSLPDVVLAF